MYLHCIIFTCLSYYFKFSCVLSSFLFSINQFSLNNVSFYSFSQGMPWASWNKYISDTQAEPADDPIFNEVCK